MIIGDHKIKNDPRNAWVNWSEEQRDFFRALHADGLSYSRIAGEFNARHNTTLTRNAVCGICHRRGLAVPMPLKPSGFRSRAVRRAMKSAASDALLTNDKSNASITMNIRRAEQRKALGIEDASPEERLGAKLLSLPIWQARDTLGTRTIEQLVDSSCRWPLATDEGATVFCPNNKGRGSYCLAHGAIAYREPHERR